MNNLKIQNGEEGQKRFRLSSLPPEANILVILILIFILFSLIDRRFSSMSNLQNIMMQLPFLVILSIGQSFPIVSKGFDLSVGAQMSVVSVVCALSAVQYGLFVGTVVGMLAGGILGATNGFMVTKLKISPLIATVGMSSFAAGLALIITGGLPVQNMASSFSLLGAGSLFHVPISFLITVIVVIVTYIVLQRSLLGRFLFATGGNEEAARLSGINVDMIKFLAYTICGILAGLSAVVLSSRVDSGIPTLGVNFTLESIAAAVIGGVSLDGGTGTILGAAFGALLLSVISNGLDLMNISSYVEMMVIGAIIVIAVYVDSLRKAGV